MNTLIFLNFFLVLISKNLSHFLIGTTCDTCVLGRAKTYLHVFMPLLREIYQYLYIS